MTTPIRRGSSRAATRRSVAVGARDTRRAEAQVVLLGVLALEAHARRRLLRERPPHARATLPCRALALEALEQRHELVVLDVSRGRDDDVPACVHGAVVGGDGAASDGRDHFRGADHGPTERVRSEYRLREEVVRRARAACPRTSRSPRGRPRAPGRARRTPARRPCRSSLREPHPGAGRGRASRPSCARATWPRSARRPSRRTSQRSAGRRTSASP